MLVRIPKILSANEENFLHLEYDFIIILDVIVSTLQVRLDL